MANKLSIKSLLEKRAKYHLVDKVTIGGLIKLLNTIQMLFILSLHLV